MARVGLFENLNVFWGFSPSAVAPHTNLNFGAIAHPLFAKEGALAVRVLMTPRAATEAAHIAHLHPKRLVAGQDPLGMTSGKRTECSVFRLDIW